MKIRTRIFLGYLLSVLLFTVSAILVYSSVSTVSDSLGNLTESYNHEKLANDLEMSASEMVRAVRGYIITKDKGVLDTFEKGLRDFQEISSKTYLIKDAAQRERVRLLADLGREYIVNAKKIIELVNQGKEDEAVALIITTANPLFDKMKPPLNDFHKEEDEELLKAEREARWALSVLNTVLLAGTVLSVVIAVSGAFAISYWISKPISGASLAISTASTEISSTIAEHERTATAQSGSVSETSATMEELGKSSSKIAEQAESVSSGMNRVIALAQEGAGAVNQSLEGIALMQEKVNSIAEQILRLSEQTAQIGSIAALVSDIAGQINILALNAAVEAVRAGEQGKGFSVLAQEVRKLADEGKKSAEKVNNIVKDIQKATNSAVMATEEGTKTVEESTKLARKTSEAFGGVSASINASFENFRQISLNISQQAAAIRQVVDAMDSINLGARETAAGIVQTKQGIEKLNETALSLKEMI